MGPMPRLCCIDLAPLGHLAERRYSIDLGLRSFSENPLNLPVTENPVYQQSLDTSFSTDRNNAKRSRAGCPQPTLNSRRGARHRRSIIFRARELKKDSCDEGQEQTTPQRQRHHQHNDQLAR